jgi:formylglycine-generating enzyme required for sulfatase activity
VQSEFAERVTFRFASALDAWQHEALRRLLLDLDGLEPVCAAVRLQRARTAELARHFEEAGRAAWASAAAAIAASPRSGGVRLEPLFGLWPLGENASSGLHEFLLEASGSAPAPAPDVPGGWVMDEEAGVVLVLLPGGRFEQGQREGEQPPYPNSRPLHALELAPFLLARHELSVAQAERLGGFPAEKNLPEDRCLPLVLDWERAHALLLQYGLEFPTEAQWEYAARAGGEPLPPLVTHANVFDRSRAEHLRQRRSRQDGTVADFDDGFPELAPIGRLAPNVFGLHDMLGNVWEWCLDHFVARGYSTLVARTGDGLRSTVVSAQLRVARGGSYADGLDVCQPARRTGDAPGKMPPATGVRPARALGPR